MQIGFICPNGQKIKFNDCFTKCTNGSRCATLSTLASMGRVREWKGKPSTTQLIAPTCMTYLKIIKDYYINPQKLVFAYIGTKAHKALEGSDTRYSILEQYFEDENMTGIADNYEEENGVSILTDYKTWGSYAVAKSLGIVSKKVQDPTGAVYKTSGAWGKAGSPKMITEHYYDASKADNEETELQLNRYRRFYEQAGFKVDKMQVQALVRDGGTIIAENRGVVKNLYLIPIKRLEDAYVDKYFETKRKMLENVLSGGSVPICNSKENWDGHRCKEYCDVAEFCPNGGSR